MYYFNSNIYVHKQRVRDHFYNIRTTKSRSPARLLNLMLSFRCVFAVMTERERKRDREWTETN